MFPVKHRFYAASRLLEHQTPTLKAVGSNPAGRTTENLATKPVAGFLLWYVMAVYGSQLHIYHMQIHMQKPTPKGGPV